MLIRVIHIDGPGDDRTGRELEIELGNQCFADVDGLPGLIGALHVKDSCR